MTSCQHLVIYFFNLDLRIPDCFPRLPEIRVQRWKHWVLAGMRRLQVDLTTWPSLESWTDLSALHPAHSLQRGQLVTCAQSRWNATEENPPPALTHMFLVQWVVRMGPLESKCLNQFVFGWSQSNLDCLLLPSFLQISSSAMKYFLAFGKKLERFFH